MKKQRPIFTDIKKTSGGSGGSDLTKSASAGAGSKASAPANLSDTLVKSTVTYP